jgi:hypothetical protein
VSTTTLLGDTDMTALQRHLVHGIAVLAAATTLAAGMTGLGRAETAPPSNDDLANAAPLTLGDVVTAGSCSSRLREDGP